MTATVKSKVSGYTSRGNIPQYFARTPLPRTIRSSPCFLTSVPGLFVLGGFPRLFMINIPSKRIAINIFRQLSWIGSVKYGNGYRDIESEVRWKSDDRDRGIQRNWRRSSQGIW